MNILLIIADTVRWDFLGYNGGHVRTPALDALAAEGTVFRRHYATSFPTVPARYDIHTGKPAYVEVGWGPLLPDDVTVAMRLSGQGYTTVGVVDTPLLSDQRPQLRPRFPLFHGHSASARGLATRAAAGPRRR
jgi:arylsulfatase A-like enzyme